jgi:hypothetical protein
LREAKQGVLRVELLQVYCYELGVEDECGIRERVWLLQVILGCEEMKMERAR